MLIGLTGRIGSGKSAAASVFRQRGAYVIDADEIAHEVLLPGGGAYDAVVHNLGEGILDDKGFIDRKKVARIVFSNPEELKRHNEATHGHILTAIEKKILTAGGADGGLICLDAPLLVESGLNIFCDAVWAVYADEATRLKRIVTRDGVTEEDARLKIASQEPFDTIRAAADLIIVNGGSEADFISEVNRRIDECLIK